MPSSATRRQWLRGSALTSLGWAAPLWAGESCPKDKACLSIGQSLPLSGPLAVYAKEKRDGAQLAFAAQNASGGIAGKTLELLTLDDAYDPRKAVANTRALAQERSMTAFMGYLGVPTIDACLPVFDELRIPVVGLTSGADSVRNPFRKYVFPVRTSYENEVEYIVKHIATLGVERVALVRLDNKLGQEGLLAYQTALKSARISVVAEHTVPFATASTHRFEDLPEDNAQAILSFLTAQPLAAWLQSFHGKGRQTPVYGVSIVGANQLFALAGASSGNVILSQVLPIPKENSKFKLVRDYLSQTKAAGGKPSSYGFEAYVEAVVLLEGIKRANGGTPETVRDALENMGAWKVSVEDEALNLHYFKKLHRGLSYVDLAYLRRDGGFVA